MCRYLPVLLIAASALMIDSPLRAEEETKTWEGGWTNRKYNTRGPLKCVATRDEDGVWTATFTGKFQGDPFSYDAKFQSKKGRRQTDLAGKAQIRGHDYEWVGFIKGKQLTGRYRSSVGYYGEFILKESSDR